MTTTTADTATEWRNDNDRDSHQRRLTDELTADEGTWSRRPADRAGAAGLPSPPCRLLAAADGPDATLEELLRLLDLTGKADAEIHVPTDCCDIFRIAELLLALDGWLSAGGFLPRRWKPATRRSA